MATSCLNTKKFRDEMQLFQKGIDTSIEKYKLEELKIKAGDNVIISVYTQASNNQDQATILNLGGIGKTNGTYLVNVSGQIDFPKIGLMKVEGLTLKELKAMLINRLSVFVKDVGVNVQLQNFVVNVIGEVKIPGAKTFTSEKVTIVDVIAASGGFGDDGKRNDIMIIREEAGNRTVHKIDFRDAHFYNSPVFQMQQNDLVFVGASDFKFRQRSVQDLSQKTTLALTFIAFFNFAVSIALLIANLNR
jgi:polysaccharide export outer membrane protein